MEWGVILAIERPSGDQRALISKFTIHLGPCQRWEACATGAASLVRAKAAATEHLIQERLLTMTIGSDVGPLQ